MSDLIDRAVATMKALPPKQRDEIARLVIALAGEAEFVELTPETDAALARSEAAAARGEFASDAEIAAIWAKHGL